MVRGEAAMMSTTLMVYLAVVVAVVLGGVLYAAYGGPR
jgi:hypothetical protein